MQEVILISNRNLMKTLSNLLLVVRGLYITRWPHSLHLMNSEGCIAVCAPQSAATVSPNPAIRPNGALLPDLKLETTALGAS